jgi:catechol 2,3-dioxygenase-like lactoylglutathione lyase family enzyme
MLGNAEAAATVPVRDIKKATQFYEQSVGLTRVGSEGDQVVLYRVGQGQLLVYQSTFAGTNQATAVTWTVPNVDEEVRALAAKGVRFEHYQGLGTLEGDVHVQDGRRVAWFKDPDGNIHAIGNNRH